MSWGLQMNPCETHSCEGLLGLHCSSRVGLGLLCFGVAFLAAIPLLLWCWVHLSATFANPTPLHLGNSRVEMTEEQVSSFSG